MPDRSKPPVFEPPKIFKIPEAVTRIADNGLPIHTISSGTLPAIKLEFFFTAGSWFETEPGNALFAIKMLGEGTSSHTSSELSAFFDRHGAFLEFNAGPDYSQLLLYTVKRHLDELCPVLAACINDPQFSEAELSLLKTIQLQQLSVNLEKNSFVASRHFRRQIFGEHHPYGTSLQSASIERQSTDQLKIFHRQHMQHHFEVIASGLIDEQNLDCIEQHFGSAGSITPTQFSAKDYAYKPQKISIPSKNELQTSIRIGKPIIRKDHRDYMACLLTNEILGGYFGSRLMQNIREEKGFTYGIYSNISTLKNDAYFAIGTDVKREYARATISEIYKEIHRISNEPVGQEELNTVKNYIKGSFLSSITTPFSIAEKVKNIRFYDLDYHFYHSFFDRLDTLTSEDIQRAAQLYFDSEEMTEVTVG